MGKTTEAMLAESTVRQAALSYHLLVEYYDERVLTGRRDADGSRMPANMTEWSACNRNALRTLTRVAEIFEVGVREVRDAVQKIELRDVREAIKRCPGGSRIPEHLD